jgi:hypothetical protein
LKRRSGSELVPHSVAYDLREGGHNRELARLQTCKRASSLRRTSSGRTTVARAAKCGTRWHATCCFLSMQSRRRPEAGGALGGAGVLPRRNAVSVSGEAAVSWSTANGAGVDRRAVLVVDVSTGAERRRERSSCALFLMVTLSPRNPLSKLVWAITWWRPPPSSADRAGTPRAPTDQHLWALRGRKKSGAPTVPRPRSRTTDGALPAIDSRGGRWRRL